MKDRNRKKKDMVETHKGASKHLNKDSWARIKKKKKQWTFNF